MATVVAEAAAGHVRVRRPEVLGGIGGRRAVADGAVATKSAPTDPVTIVDTETERLVRDLLARLRPGDSVLGEEAGGGDAPAGGVQWVVDPIDGTVNFVYGLPAYAVSLAARVDGVTLAGVVVDVSRRLTYRAVLGGGAEVIDADGEAHSLVCSDRTELATALIATGFGYASARRERQAHALATVLPAVRDIRRVGSAALDLCMVATGTVDASYEHGLHPWDWAAGALIAAEAGAIVRLPSGPTDLTLAAAPGIADDLLDLLDRAGIAGSIDAVS
nr:inositol monophosphatase family protein [Millisia brevis]